MQATSVAQNDDQSQLKGTPSCQGNWLIASHHWIEWVVPLNHYHLNHQSHLPTKQSNFQITVTPNKGGIHLQAAFF